MQSSLGSMIDVVSYSTIFLATLSGRIITTYCTFDLSYSRALTLLVGHHEEHLARKN